MLKNVALQMFHEEENEFSLCVRLQGQTQRWLKVQYAQTPV